MTRGPAKWWLALRDRLQRPAGPAAIVARVVAMLVWPVSRKMAMARLRGLAMTSRFTPSRDFAYALGPTLI